MIVGSASVGIGGLVFASFYCLSGKDGAHEKGGVEGEGGWFRRNRLVPMPKVASVAELNDLLATLDAADCRRSPGQNVGSDRGDAQK